MTYVTGWSEQSEGYNPEWKSRFDRMYGYNPARAKELLKEAGYGPGLKLKIVAFTEPGESEGPQVAEALGISYKEVGIESEIEVLDWAKVRDMFRRKAIHCCIWPNNHLLAAVGGVGPDELPQQGERPPLRERAHRQDPRDPDQDREPPRTVSGWRAPSAITCSRNSPTSRSSGSPTRSSPAPRW